MSKETVETAVEILGRIYYVKCPSSEMEELQQAAKYVEEKLNIVCESSQVIGLDRIAIITALNMAHELLALKRKENHYSQVVNQKLYDLKNKVDEALFRHAQMEFPATEEI